MSPKVSVIIPVYNSAEYLGQCLDSIFLQTLNDIEVICVDDGSTDDSPSILSTYAMLDDRLKLVHQENAGPGVARNRGMQEATGEFIIFLDSDDFFHKEMLEKMVAKPKKMDRIWLCVEFVCLTIEVKKFTKKKCLILIFCLFRQLFLKNIQMICFLVELGCGKD